MKFTLDNTPTNIATLEIDSNGNLNLRLNGYVALYIKPDGSIRVATDGYDFVDGPSISKRYIRAIE